MDPRPTQPDAQLEQIWNDHYDYLVGLAHRLLRDRPAAEDVTQDAFSRLMGTDINKVRDLRAWLTVVVRRLSLNRLQSAYTRREAVSDITPWAEHNNVGAAGDRGPDPADRLTLDDQVQMALALVLDRLTPAERTAFLLHDVFGFSYDVIGSIVGRNPAACRQLASRARRTVRTPSADDDTDPVEFSEPLTGDLAQQHSLVVERFIAAASGGNLAELLAILDPAVTGEATLLEQGIVLQVDGAERAARRIIDLFGPHTGSELLPIPLDGAPGIVATTRHRVAVIRVDTRRGVIHHLRAFVSHQPA